MSQSRRDLLPGTLDMLVLRVLQGGRLHGYAIARWIQQSSEDVLQVEEGSLYPALHRMESKGWIESEWGLSEANRRAKYYRLTRSGSARLRAQRKEWAQMSEAISRLLERGADGAL